MIAINISPLIKDAIIWKSSLLANFPVDGECRGLLLGQKRIHRHWKILLSSILGEDEVQMHVCCLPLIDLKPSFSDFVHLLKHYSKES
jgi:hypothetical protein